MRKLVIIILCLTLAFSSLIAEARPAFAETTALVVLINEIHYDPSLKNARLEFVELTNAGAEPVNLTGWSLAKAVDFVFPPGTVLAAGGYLVVAQNPAGLKAAYGASSLGPFSGKLANVGDEVLLRDRTGQPIDQVDYRMGFPWPIPAAAIDQSIGLISLAVDNGQPGAWRSGQPTPGQPNANRMDNLPPFVDAVSHLPLAPRATDQVTIQAHVTDADGVAAVRVLVQSVIPGRYIRLTDPAYASSWAQIQMVPIGNDLYAAEVPAAMRRNRTLVRYRVEATDSGGRWVTTPYADDPTPNFAFFVYDGAPAWTAAVEPAMNGEGGVGRTAYDFAKMPTLPVYQLIADEIDVANSQFIAPSGYLAGYMGNDYPWQGTMVVNGVVYDHISFRARGGGFRYSVGKNHWKFNFNRGHGLQAYDDYGQPYAILRDKLSFSAVTQHNNRKYRGEQGLFETLAYRLFNMNGVAAPDTNFVHFRVVDQAAEVTANQYVGDFWGLYLAIENVDGRLLQAHGLPDGNLYEMQDYTGDLDNLGDTGVADQSDLAAFLWEYTSRTLDPARWQAIFDLEGYYKFRSVLEAVHDYDVDQAKNYSYYLNPDSGKWSILPWDLDLTWAESMFGEGNEPFRDRVLAIPAFNVAYQNHLRELRDLLFSPEQMVPMIDEVAALIDTAAGGNSMVDADRALWDFNPILNSRYVSSTRAVQGKYYSIAPTRDFPGMVQLMKEYVGRRAAWIDQALLTDRDYPVTPAIAYTGPAGHPADQLTFQASGFVDPQGAGTFAALQWRAAELIRPGLPAYVPGIRPRYEIEATWLSAGLPATAARMSVPRGACRPGVTCRVRVRMQDNTGRWSHWSPALEFVTGAPGLAPITDLHISEIMYKPALADDLPGEELEFLELQNGGQASVDLSGLHFTAGIDYTFPMGAALAPGAHWVLAKHKGYFAARYGFAADGVYAKELSNKGERLTLVDAFGAPVLDVTYGDGGDWPVSADGWGASLVATTLSGDPNDATSWRPSTLLGGSPGAADPIAVVVNEIAVDAQAGAAQTVELYNPSTQDADVSGWLLSVMPGTLPARGSAAPAGLRLPAGSVVPAGGYLAVPTLGVAPALPIAAGSSVVTLLAATAGGMLSGYSDRTEIGVPPAGTTLGRVQASDGHEHFVAQRAPSLGSANSGPQVGPVVLSRLLVAPSDGLQWIELTNSGAAPVDLYDATHLHRRWIVGGVVFEVPVGVTLPPDGRALLTNAEPADVCLAGRVPPGVRVIGPFNLPLASSAMEITLLAPTAWGAADGWAPAEVDGVQYGAGAAWPTLVPDTTLARVDLAAYGDDPTNWRAAPLALSGEPALTPAGIDVCSFDVYVNADAQMEIRWVATPQAGTATFRLLRSPLDNLTVAETIDTQVLAVTGASDAPAGYKLVDAAADPHGEYLYRLQSVNADGTATDLAVTTPRATVHLVRVPVVYR